LDASTSAMHQLASNRSGRIQPGHQLQLLPFFCCVAALRCAVGFNFHSWPAVRATAIQGNVKGVHDHDQRASLEITEWRNAAALIVLCSWARYHVGPTHILVLYIARTLAAVIVILDCMHAWRRVLVLVNDFGMHF